MKTDFIEVVSDTKLRKREKEIAAIVKAVYPDCGRVRLYRTGDGRVGFQMQVTLTPDNRKQLDKVYRAVMKCLGEERGRPRGVETVQTKLRLPKPIYSALRKAAVDSDQTMSSVVAESLVARFERRRRQILGSKKNTSQQLGGRRPGRKEARIR
jgi:hypothetical protein